MRRSSRLTALAATVQKIVTEILPPASGVAFAKEARDLLIECCVEFITLVSSEANEISEKEAKKTIACDHITKALEQLGFADYVPAVLDAAAEHKEVQKVSLRLPGGLCREERDLPFHRDARRRQTSSRKAGCRWRSWSACSRSSLPRLRPDIRNAGVRRCGIVRRWVAFARRWERIHWEARFSTRALTLRDGDIDGI